MVTYILIQLHLKDENVSLNSRVNKGYMRQQRIYLRGFTCISSSLFFCSVRLSKRDPRCIWNDYREFYLHFPMIWTFPMVSYINCE